MRYSMALNLQICTIKMKPVQQRPAVPHLVQCIFNNKNARLHKLIFSFNLQILRLISSSIILVTKKFCGICASLNDLSA